MTREEIDKIPFKFSSHLSMKDKHCTTYFAEYKGHEFGICAHVPVKENNPHGRSYRHYAVDGKVFKTKEKLYEYCETLCEIKKI